MFLAVGLQGINALMIKNEEMNGVINAVEFIEQNRQNKNIKVGKDVAVIGGGSTAIDAAVQAKILGSRNVTIFYRNSKNKMSATLHEQTFAKEFGVNIRYVNHS